MAKTIATVLGVAFLLVGILGFVNHDFLGYHLALVHNLVHIISGAVALYFGLAGSLAGARMFCIVFGIVYGGLGVVGFLLGRPAAPSGVMANMGTDPNLLTIIPGQLELGRMDHILHILLGIVFIVGGFLTKADVERAADRVADRT